MFKKKEREIFNKGYNEDSKGVSAKVV